jgi:hypothetical protein
MRATLILPGRTPVSAPLNDLQAVLDGDPSARNALIGKGRVRLVLADGARSEEAAREVSGILNSMGLLRALEVETLGIERPKSGRPIASDEPARDRGWASSLAAPLRELGFLGRNFAGSLSRPSRTELAGGALTSLPGLATNAAVFTAAFLPDHWGAFAAIMALTLAMKALHNVFVDSWTGFQNRLDHLRSSTYLAGFNFLYGQTIAALYRLISWIALPASTIPPWALAYWRDMSVMSALGTVFYTVGNMAANELYDKGILSRKGRALLQQARAGLGDVEGVFYKIGWMPMFWIAFAIHQLLDLALYPFAAWLSARPVLYVSSESTASTPEFQARYLEPKAGLESPGKRILKALAGAPFVAQLIALGGFAWRRAPMMLRLRTAALAAAVAITPETLALRYARAASLAERPESEAAVSRLPLLRPVLGEDGRPVAAGDAISQPVLTDYPGGGLGVFKRSPSQGMLKTDPNYKFERFKIACDLAASFIMEKMGVATVRYRMARAEIDGVEYAGVVSPYLPGLKTLDSDPAAAAEIVNGDEFVRGSVIDAWFGNADRIRNLKNVWIVDSGGRASVLFGDYDQAMRPGVSLFGVPKVQAPLFERYARRETVDKAVSDIAALDDARIKEWVGEALGQAGGFADSWRDYIAEVLIYNRGRLGGAFDGLLSGRPERLRLGAAQADAIAGKVLRGSRDPARSAALVEEALRGVLYLGNHPELEGPMKALLSELARRRLAGEDGSYEIPGEQGALFPALVNFVWANFSPEEAIRAGFGYHR